MITPSKLKEIDLVVVDAPNLFIGVGDALRDRGHSREVVRDYLRNYFDIDRLVRATLGVERPKLGTVVYHSSKNLGGGRGYALDNKGTTFFWDRNSSNPDTSCLLVSLAGEQAETFTGPCEHCNKPTTTENVTEKGVDTSITVFLFETDARWNSVCLFSKDSDFVPPVAAFRRRGKQVFVAFDRRVKEAAALVRASQSFFDIDFDFLSDDIRLFSLVTKDGVFEKVVAALQPHDVDVALYERDFSGRLGLYVRLTERTERSTADWQVMKQLVTDVVGQTSLRVLPWSASASHSWELQVVVNPLLGEGYRRNFERVASPQTQALRGTEVPINM